MPRSRTGRQSLGMKKGKKESHDMLTFDEELVAVGSEEFRAHGRDDGKSSADMVDG